MAYTVKSNRIEIASDVFILERMITGLIGAYLLYALVFNPSSFFRTISFGNDIPIMAIIPSILAGIFGALFGIFLIYRTASRPKSEIIEWDGDELKIQFGTYSLKRRGENKDLDLFKRKYHFSKNDIDSLKLNKYSGGNEITIDLGKKRLRVASSLSEIEREEVFHKIVSLIKTAET